MNKTALSPVYLAKNNHPVVDATVNHYDRSETFEEEIFINDFNFVTKITLDYIYEEDGDGWDLPATYDFSIEDVEVILLRVYDEEGELVALTPEETIQIENSLQNNIHFNLTKKF